LSKSFFAYPSQPPELAATIRSSLKILRDEYRLEGFNGWEETDIAGRFIIEPILGQIDDCDFLAADVTRLNFNVTYEIGYAIGRKRRIRLTRNSCINADDSLIREMGIFDTLGYKPYSDDRNLANTLRSVADFRAYELRADGISMKQPVYVILPKTKNEYEIHLLSQVKKAKLRFRSFDPDCHWAL
jgi:hypothetical protein